MFDNFQQANRFFADRRQFGVKPGLDRMYTLLYLLNQPQNKSPAIHIAGTNGKGSTVHYLKNALVMSGFQVGVFTSPSLNGITGYIWLNNTPIPEHTFIKILNQMYSAIQAMDAKDNHPTEFEIITAMAFVYFSNRVDIALIEAGMGGREDTTNCFRPLFSIITNVARDHTAFLGGTISAIAGHKAGIIKHKRPVIVGDVPPEALKVIRQEAERNETSIYQFGRDFWLSPSNEVRGTFSSICNWSDGQQQKKLRLIMKGKHQQQNAALVLMALSLLEQGQYRIKWDPAMNGIAHTRVPGRFEQIGKQPAVVLDGAHNVAGTESFIQTMLQYFPNEKRHLLFAGFQDKALSQMLQKLTPHFTTITLTSFDHSRAINAETLFQQMGSRDIYTVQGNWHDMIKKQMDQPAYGNILFVTGSLNFILDVRRYLLNHFSL